MRSRIIDASTGAPVHWPTFADPRDLMTRHMEARHGGPAVELDEHTTRYPDGYTVCWNGVHAWGPESDHDKPFLFWAYEPAAVIVAVAIDFAKSQP